MITPLLKDDFKLKSYDANMNRQRELNWLSNYQPHIVISTPEKLNDLSNNGLNIRKTKYLILDEADMMFDEYYLSQIDIMINKFIETKYLLFSATITNDMHQFIKKYFGSYDLIDTTNQHKLNIEHRLIRINYETRDEVLKKVLNNLNPYLAIIFVSKKEDQIKVYQNLKIKFKYCFNIRRFK